MKIFHLFMLLHCFQSVYSQFDFDRVFGVAVDVMGTAADLIGRTTGLTELCPFVEDPVDSLDKLLPRFISGQGDGIEIVLKSLRAWQLSRLRGQRKPLVLAITGPTGVGKSESASLIAEAVLEKRERVGISKTHRPIGMLVLRGEDYSSTSDAFITGGLPEVRRRLNLRMVEHMRLCGGGGVVVFDEVQKVVPGTLEILVPGLKERGQFSIQVNVNTPSETTEVYDTGNLIFLLVSDIGADRMIKLMLAYGDRSLIPVVKMREEVKKALDAQWDRLNMGMIISDVVPYLPLERQQIEEIMTLKLMALDVQRRNDMWLSLCVEPEVITHLSSGEYITYDKPRIRVPTAEGKEVVRELKIAKYGARNIENGGPLRDLIGLVAEYMKPWNSALILHVGMENYDPTQDGREANANAEMYLQWCLVDASMLPPHVKSPVERGLINPQAFKRLEGLMSATHRNMTENRVGYFRVGNLGMNTDLCQTNWRGNLARETLGGERKSKV